MSRVNVNLTRFSNYVYALPFIHCLYFIYARKIYVRTHVKITLEWKSSFTRGLSCIASVLFERVKFTSARTYNYATVDIAFTRLLRFQISFPPVARVSWSTRVGCCESAWLPATVFVFGSARAVLALL